MMETKRSTYRISALDTWFFRESRPMEAIGGSELTSVFPPPPRTLLGALRTAIGNHEGVDWSKLKQNEGVRRLIGYGDGLGPLRLLGLWLCYNHERLYPVPAYLLGKTTEAMQYDYRRLRIGDTVQKTHLGRVRLPCLPNDSDGYKALNNVWVTASGLKKLLQGGIPEQKDLIPAEKLFGQEARLGIARDYKKQVVEDGALYQTKHLRPTKELTLEIDIEHASESLKLNGWVRLGGEGRPAHLKHIGYLEDKTTLKLSAPKPDQNTCGLILNLLSPARFTQQDRSPAWLPAEFNRRDDDSWHGAIHGVELTLQSAMLGKAQREGGWDMATHKPRAVHSLIPAGSAYYCTLVEATNQSKLKKAIEQLHGRQIGEQTALGRGLIACGLWQRDEGASV